MRPFRLNEYKDGDELVTRNGFPARMLCTDLKTSQYVLVAAVNFGEREEIYTFTSTGMELRAEDGDFDLFFKPQTMTMYCNVYARHDGAAYFGNHYKTKSDVPASCNSKAIATVTWKEEIPAILKVYNCTASGGGKGVQLKGSSLTETGEE